MISNQDTSFLFIDIVVSSGPAVEVERMATTTSSSAEEEIVRTTLDMKNMEEVEDMGTVYEVQLEVVGFVSESQYVVDYGWCP